MGSTLVSLKNLENNMDAVETLTDEATGVTALLYVDDWPTNPRDWEEGDGVVITQLDSGYAQPDAHYDPNVVTAWERYRDWDKLERYARSYLGAVAVAIYDDPHSSSRLFAYLPAGTDYTDPQSAVEGQLAEYVSWCEGDVYGIVVKSPLSDESCWGYIGYEYACMELTEQFKAEVEYVHKVRAEQFKSIFHTEQRHAHV